VTKNQFSQQSNFVTAKVNLRAAYPSTDNWNDFDRSFVSYISKSQIDALQALADTTADAYSENQNWDWIEGKERQWNRMTAQMLRKYNRGQRTGSSRNNSQSKSGGDNRRDNNGRPPSHPPPRLFLTDVDKNPIVGKKNTDNESSWLPIILDGNVIGHLGYTRANGAPGRLEQLFAETQKKNLAWASLIMVAVSGLLAALLAARIVKPVLTVSHAVGEINRGLYDQRVPTTRQDELGDLSRDVNQLAHTLEKSRAARRKWIAEISHELRTPVAILQGEIEAIEDGIRPFNNSTLGSLQTETKRLSRLINDLHDLSLSDLGALEYRMESLDLAILIQQRLDSAESQRNETKLSIDFNIAQGPIHVLGDSTRLSQLVDNLLQNSLRYTNASGSIKIDLRFNADKSAVELNWKDSSPGIDDIDLPKLFDPLYRTEPSRNRAHGGAGLGLAIAQKIVSAHHGSIQANHSDMGGLAKPLLKTNPNLQACFKTI